MPLDCGKPHVYNSGMDGYQRRMLIDEYHPFIPESMIVPNRESVMDQRSWKPKKKKRKKTPLKQSRAKTKILHELQSGLCFYCGKSVSLESATKDHRVPISKGGSNEMSNLVMACPRCNIAKGSKSEEEFRLIIKEN